MQLPISAIVPTRNRKASLERMLASLSQQSGQPAEIVIVDASSTGETERYCTQRIPGLTSRIAYHKAETIGAAAQRNQALESSSEACVLFLDDDIIFESDCIVRLWKALQSDALIGGVNSMISNQSYLAPGLISRALFRYLNGGARGSYAGKCIGPAFNLLPQDDPQLPEVMPVDWLNTTCTLYRRIALPVPAFSSHFTGYSLMEDVALSLIVGRSWKLANARTARIFHDSQSDEYKNNPGAMATMELVNRHYVMTSVMGRDSAVDYLKLLLVEVFGIVTPLVSPPNWARLPSVLFGKSKAVGRLISSRQSV